MISRNCTANRVVIREECQRFHASKRDSPKQREGQVCVLGGAAMRCSWSIRSRSGGQHDSPVVVSIDFMSSVPLLLHYQHDNSVNGLPHVHEHVFDGKIAAWRHAREKPPGGLGLLASGFRSDAHSRGCGMWCHSALRRPSRSGAN